MPGREAAIPSTPSVLSRPAPFAAAQRHRLPFVTIQRRECTVPRRTNPFRGACLRYGIIQIHTAPCATISAPIRSISRQRQSIRGRFNPLGRHPARFGADFIDSCSFPPIPRARAAIRRRFRPFRAVVHDFADIAADSGTASTVRRRRSQFAEIAADSGTAFTVCGDQDGIGRRARPDLASQETTAISPTQVNVA